MQSSQTTTKHADILNIQNGTEENQNKENSSLIHREQIENSGIWIIGSEDKGYFATFAKFKLTENMDTPEHVKYFIEDFKWDIITKIIACTVQLWDEQKNSQQEVNE